MAVPTIQTFGQTAGSQYRHAQIALMAAKGVADDNIYPLTIDPVTGAIASSPTTVFDFGDTTVAGRVAAMIGSVDDTGSYGSIFRTPNGNIQTSGLINEDFRGVDVTYPSGTQEVFTYYKDALKSDLLCVVTIDYADATKAQVTSIVRT